MNDSPSRRYGGANPVGGGQQPPTPPAPSWPPPNMHQGPWQPPAAGSPPSPTPDGGDPGRALLPIRKSRKPLLVTLGAGAAVLVVIIIVLVVTLVGGDRERGGGGSAADAVTGYLEALARGDAAAALSYSDKDPASLDFLTDDVLKKQVAKWPITNIRILNAGSGEAATGRVHVSATFGTTISEARMRLTRKNSRWYLDNAAIVLPQNPAPDASDKTLTVFGKPFGQSRQYVFPGWVDIASSNPYVDATANPTTQSLLLDRLTAREHYLQADFAINKNGEKAVIDATVAAFAKCQQSHAIKPPYPCSEVGLPADKYVDGTVDWGEADLGELNSTFDHRNLAVNFWGRITNDCTAQTTAGGSDHFTAQHYVKGVADLSTIPPTLKFG